MSTDDLTLSRRGLIGVLGGGVASVAFGARALDAFGADNADVATCVLTPEVTEGPYWIDNKLTRYDVREGKPGLPLVLEFTIVNAKTCKPIRNADVEIWHADASGNYSGFDGGSSGGGPGRRLGAADEDALSPRSPAVGRARQGELPDRLPRLVPGPDAPYPHEGARRRRRPGRPHRPGVLQRGDPGVRSTGAACTGAAARRTRRTRRT